MIKDNCQGVCPLCHSDDIEYEHIQLEDDMAYFPYTCKNCDNQGEEWYYLKFNGHSIGDREIEYIDLEQKRKEKNIKLDKEETDEVKVEKLDVRKLVKELEENAWYGGDKTEAYIMCNKDIIELRGTVYESGYEDFSTTCCIKVNGKTLFNQYARNVAAYRNEVFVEGKYKTFNEAIDEVESLLKDNNFTMQYTKPEIKKENKKSGRER